MAHAQRGVPPTHSRTLLHTRTQHPGAHRLLQGRLLLLLLMLQRLLLLQRQRQVGVAAKLGELAREARVLRRQRRRRQLRIHEPGLRLRQW